MTYFSNIKTILLFSIISITTIGVISLFLIEKKMTKEKDYYFSWVDHTHKVLNQISILKNDVQDHTEHSLGYTITGDSIFIREYDLANKNIPLVLNKLIELTRDNQNQQQRLDTLKHLIDYQLKFSNKTIQLRNEKKFNSLQQYIVSHPITDKLPVIINDFQNEELRLLSLRQTQYLKSISHEKNSLKRLIISVLLLIIVLIFSFWYYGLERIKAKSALFIMNQWYSKTLIGLNEGVISTSIDGIIILINKSACELTGWKEEEAIGSHIDMVFDAINNKSEFKVSKQLKEEMQKNNIINNAEDTILKRKDGRQLFIDKSEASINGENGEKIGVIHIFRNISEKKKAAEALLKSLKETNDYKYALNESSIVAITDKRGTITYSNDNFCNISKYSKEELIGQNHRIVNSGYHSKEFFKEMYVSISKGNIWHGEIKNKAKDGTFYWTDTCIVPFMNEKGKPHQYIAIRNDITEQKNYKEQLIQYQQELEIKVEERTKDLVYKERNLEIQNRELIKINRELDRFVYSTSHDLRAPLKSIIGLINITLDADEPENADQIERLEMINKSAVKLDDFIENILDYYRNSRIEEAKEEINFEGMLQEIKETHKFIQGLEELDFQVEIHEKEKFISDKQRMNVILNNLISNAIKYKDISKDASFVNIIVECSKENAIITIEDNGIGIAEDKQKKIFEMFYRGTKLSSGSGMGMYIVKETLDILGGRITLESELNKGTKFIIELPNQLKLVSI